MGRSGPEDSVSFIQAFQNHMWNFLPPHPVWVSGRHGEENTLCSALSCHHDAEQGKSSQGTADARSRPGAQ